MYRKTALLLFLTGLLFSAFSQEELIRKFDIQSNNRIDVSGKVTAIVFKTDQFLGTTVELTINGEIEEIPFDADGPEFTYYKSLDGAKELTSFSSDYEGSLHLIYSGITPKIGSNFRSNQQDECDFTPTAIPQSEWRAGLPEPSYSRSFTDVEHVIVHHSAGSNSATDYTQVVRDIYIYHTQSNGWSDIGYNYVIAQNGDLYAARDPEGGDQDNVIGAHFCGSNGHTMGICLLGNYETAEPTVETWNTLEKLAAYKLNKESLDPQLYSDHPLGYIGNLAGHRDGCSTSCPGENVYKKLEMLRDSTSNTLVSCDALDLQLDFSLSTNSVQQGGSIEFVNNSTGYFAYTWLLSGAETSFAEWPSRGSATYQDIGTFDVVLVGESASGTDTFRIADAVTVEKFYLLEFSTNTEEINSGESITFENLSIGYNGYKWLLEGADPQQPTWQESGEATYENAGEFDVTLIGYKEQGSDTLLIENHIKVVNRLLLSMDQNRFFIRPEQQVTFVNNSSGYDDYEWVFEGGVISSSSDQEAVVSYNYPGVFDALLIGEIDDRRDTIHANRKIEVSGFSVFPNPSPAFSEIVIATNNTVNKIEIIGMDGKSYLTDSNVEQNTLQLPYLRQGIYVLKIYTSGGLEKQRLLIN